MQGNGFDTKLGVFKTIFKKVKYIFKSLNIKDLKIMV